MKHTDIHGINIRICDSHVHVGRFGENQYFSPEIVGQTLLGLGLKKWVVSSTSTVDNDFPLVVEELNRLINISPTKTVPILWVTPEMVSFSKDLSYYLNQLHFFGFKIHPFTENWEKNIDKLNTVFEIAQALSFPILIHTGWTPESNASKFNSIIKLFSDVKTVLAHGRPIEQASKVLSSNENAFVDTAFMPMKDIKKLSDDGFSDRILFGSDFPIERYFYKRISLKKRYENRIQHLVSSFGVEEFMKWSNENYGKLYPL